MNVVEIELARLGAQTVDFDCPGLRLKLRDVHPTVFVGAELVEVGVLGGRPFGRRQTGPGADRVVSRFG